MEEDLVNWLEIQFYKSNIKNMEVWLGGKV